VLVGGHDFFASPRLSPDGSRLIWLAWDHPNMPWNGSTLYLAQLDEAGGIAESRAIAGGPANSAAIGASGSTVRAAARTGLISSRSWKRLQGPPKGRAEAKLEVAVLFGRKIWPRRLVEFCIGRQQLPRSP
jgi:hypothetical protein